MIIWIAVFLYLVTGIAVSRLYNKRDSTNSVSVASIIDRNLDKMKNKDDGFTEYLFNITLRSSISHAGWWYWRRKKPFLRLPMLVNDVLGVILWPIDIIMCEVGHQKELDYLQSIFSAEKKGATK